LQKIHNGVFCCVTGEGTANLEQAQYRKIFVRLLAIIKFANAAVAIMRFKFYFYYNIRLF